MATQDNSMSDSSFPSQELLVSVEAVAMNGVVACIQSVVKEIREIPEFQPQTLSLASRKNGSATGTKDDRTRSIRVYTRLRDAGIVKRVNEIKQQLDEILTNQPERGCDVFENAANNVGIDDERSLLLHMILIPLIGDLGRCYAVLDQAPPPSTAPQTSALLNRSKRSPSVQSPPPPIGMLSVQHYTDVAACLELLICSSILPKLEPHVLWKAAERAHYTLPKSIAGRVPLPALTWASLQTQKHHDYWEANAAYELVCTASALGSVLLLDRFRPMLLPRHVADIYAALLQGEALLARVPLMEECRPTVTRLQILSRRVGLDAASVSSCVVDSHSQARALQKLLLQGTRAPSWLRLRVGKLLNDLACRDLPSIVDVFVQAAPKERIAASTRLAQVLVPKTIQPKTYYQAILKQMFVLLDRVGVTTESKVVSIESLQLGGLSRQDSCSLDLVRAVLDRLPFCFLEEQFLPELVKLFTGQQERGVHVAVRRLGVLTCQFSPSFDPSRISHLMLYRIDGCEKDLSIGTPLNLLGLLTRVAVMPSVLHLAVKDDSLWTLRATLHAISRSAFGTDGDSIDSVDVSAVAVLYALAPSSSDMEGYAFRSVSGEGEANVYDSVSYRKCAGSNIDDKYTLEQAVGDIEKRAVFVVEKLLLPLCSPKEDLTSLTQEMLPSRMFQLTLTLYFKTFESTQEAEKTASLCNVLFRQDLFRLVSLVLLPLLCDQCPPATLLLSASASQGVFDLMKLVFRLADEIGNDQIASHSSPKHNSLKSAEMDDAVLQFLPCASFFCKVLHLKPPIIITYERAFGSSNDEVLLSVTSVLLSLLVGVLELGAEKRSSSDESVLRSLVPLLKSLASEKRTSAATSSAYSEISEVASHAMALIACRREGRQKPSSSTPISFAAKIIEIQEEITSFEPPIRARGVVLLRHLAASLLRDDILGSQRNSKVISSDDESEDKLERILVILFFALKDQESYVFLAAIQTLVAIADERPTHFLPLLCRGVSLGAVQLAREEVLLSSEQRIKVAEALLFVIRRRAGIYEHLSSLLGMLALGSVEKLSHDLDTPSQALQIAEETHAYFLNIESRHAKEEELSAYDAPDDVDVRLRTGGPLFASEEADAVIASIMNVVTEAVVIAHPSLSAHFCSVLISCAVEKLRLGSARPLRRAGALLARELYGSLIREQDEFLNSITNDKESCCPMSVAMVSAGEESLYATLVRCVNNYDLKDSQLSRTYDPTTAIRCQEALQLREQGEAGGILPAGRLVAASKSEDEKNPIVRLFAQENRDSLIEKIGLPRVSVSQL